MSLACRMQADRSNAGSDIQPSFSLDAHRLQRDGVTGATQEHVRSPTCSDRCHGRCPGVGTFKPASGGTRRRRKNGPDDYTVFAVADIHTEFPDFPRIVLDATVHWPIGAT